MIDAVRSKDTAFGRPARTEGHQYKDGPAASRRKGMAMRTGQNKGMLGGRSPTKVPDYTAAFKQALGFHQTGRLADAEKIYRQILETQPNHFDSLHLLGLVYSQRGKHAEAVRQINAALKTNSKCLSENILNRLNLL
jgi:tetratricopeptide (TPR) repeat protein